jgi:hypothetical protein
MTWILLVAMVLGAHFSFTAPAALLLVAWVAIVAFVAPARGHVVTGPLGLGARRLAHGYLGAFAALLFLLALALGLGGGLGWPGEAMALDVPARFARVAAVFVVYAVSVLIATPILTFVGLPLLVVLRRLGMLSVVGAVAAGQAIVVVLVAFSLPLPPLERCPSGGLECASGGILLLSISALAVALGFALGARLPWLLGDSPRLGRERNAESPDPAAFAAPRPTPIRANEGWRWWVIGTSALIATGLAAALWLWTAGWRPFGIARDFDLPYGYLASRDGPVALGEYPINYRFKPPAGTEIRGFRDIRPPCGSFKSCRTTNGACASPRAPTNGTLVSARRPPTP